VLDEIDESVIVADTDGSILYSNPATEDLYGWSAADLAGLSLSDVLTSETNSDWLAESLEQLTSGNTWEGELRSRRRDDPPLTAVVRITRAFNDDDRPVGVIAVSCDVASVNGHHELSEPPEANLHLLEALIGSSGEVFVVLEPNGVIESLYGSTERSLSSARDFLVGTSAFDFVQPGDLERARAWWARCLSTKGPLPAEHFWVERANGAARCISLALHNLLDDPAVGGMVGVARDITARTNLERAQASMSAANSALLHASTEIDLFNRLCRVVVDDDVYRLAWIGVTDPDRPLGVRMVAFANHSSVYIDALEMLAGVDIYRGPIVLALESHKLHVVQDVTTVPGASTWKRLALEQGYRSLIALPLFVGKTDYGVLAIYSQRANVFTPDAIAVLADLADELSYGIKTLRTREEGAVLQARLQGSLESAVQAIALASELRDPYTAGHQRRVGQLACAIATEIKIDPELIIGIQVAATIHDVGKLTVPAEILSSPGRLKDPEFALIKGHPQAGHDIIAGIEFPWPVPEMVLQHHERLDGSGYPRGLRGSEIATGARILAVADTVEAITSHRPYRPALGIDKALEVIRDGRGTLFDPDVVDGCCRLFDEQGFSFEL